MSDDATGRLRTAVNVLGLVLLVALLVPFVVYAAPSVVGADHSYTVVSGSMAPAIQTGDAVIVRSVPPEQIHEGDVVTFRNEDGRLPTTHRVVERTRRDGRLYFRTRGDANAAADPRAVPGGRIVGRVLVTLPFVGYVVGFGSTTAGFALFVVAPLTLLVVTELLGVLRSGGDGEGDDDDSGGGDGGGGGGGSGDHDGGDGGGGPVPLRVEPAREGVTAATAGEGDDEGTATEAGDGDDETTAETEPPVARRGDAASGSRSPDDGDGTAVTAGDERTTQARTPVEADGGGVTAPEVVVTRADLRLSGVVTAAFAGYAGWVVYETGVSAWSVGVFVAGLLAVGFLAAFYIAAGGERGD